MLEVALLGATGRMGQAVVQLLREAPDARLRAAMASPRSPALGRDAGEVSGGVALGVAVGSDLAAALAHAQVVIDFSLPEAVAGHVEACRAHGRALVLGVTALDPSVHAALRLAATRIPVVYSPNMSVGVNLCFALVAQAARALGAEYDVEILEMHHRNKRDAPSGTALRFGEIVSAARVPPAPLLRGERCGERPRGAVGFASLRAGAIAGEHTVMFAGDAERIEISHRAASRTAFAAGALAAARWVTGRPPGLYGMHEVLGLAWPGGAAT